MALREIYLSDSRNNENGSVKYLVSGLRDMHVHDLVVDDHGFLQEQLFLFIANGATGVRHMQGSPPLLMWRKEIEAGALIGPRMVIASPFNPACFIGREKEIGAIQKGKIADMVVLDANPLEEIGNTRKIHAVVVNGHLFNRGTLDEMLLRAKAIAKK